MNSEKSNCRKFTSVTLKLGAIALSLYALADLGPWIFAIAFWTGLGVPIPPASAYYELNVRNATENPIIVTVENLNDLSFKVRSAWVKRLDERLGRKRTKEALLTPGETQLLVIPSELEPRLGVLMVTARSPIEFPGTGKACHSFAVYFLSWCQASLQPPNPDGKRIVPTLVVDKNDFQKLDSSLPQPSNDIRVLRRPPLNAIRESNWDWPSVKTDNRESLP